MKIFTLLIILFFCSSVIAEDISDFEIEGIYLGDSLLDHFNKEKILNSKEYLYKSNKFRHFELFSSKFIKYNAVHVFFKRNDKNYIIESLAGVINFQDNIFKCYKQLIDIDSSSLLNFEYKSRTERDYDHPGDITGNSSVREISYEFIKGYVYLQCMDWSKELEYTDHLRIELSTHDVDDFLYNDAF